MSNKDKKKPEPKSVATPKPPAPMPRNAVVQGKPTIGRV